MSNIFADVLRVETSGATGLSAVLRNKQSGHEADGSKRMGHKMASGDMEYWTPDGYVSATGIQYTTDTYPLVGNVEEALDTIVGALTGVLGTPGATGVAGLQGDTGAQGATGASGSSLSGLIENLVLVGFTGGTYTQYTGLSFYPLDQNYNASLEITNSSGNTNRIQTGSGDEMKIVAFENLAIDTYNHPRGFNFSHENGDNDPYFTIDARVGMNSADGRIRMYHPASNTPSYIIADSSDGILISTGKIAFYTGSTPQTKATVSGAKGSNAALGSLLTALSNLGLITDSTTT